MNVAFLEEAFLGMDFYKSISFYALKCSKKMGCKFFERNLFKMCVRNSTHLGTCLFRSTKDKKDFLNMPYSIKKLGRALLLLIKKQRANLTISRKTK